MTKEIVRQLDHIFKAKSVAVIGASNSPAKWGYRMINNPLITGYRGALYAVNPSEKEVLGLHSYPSLGDVPGDVELAVIVVPAATVPKVMEECVAKGVKGAVVITAGFAETGKEGKSLQDEVVRIARKGGIRFVGPNCMGIWSSAVRLSLCFDEILKGHTAFMSQSGTYGGFLARVAVSRGYGLSKFASIGNQAEIGAADYLEYLGEDDDTKAICFYMEGFRDGRKFFEVAREVVKKKPIIIYKAGRSEAAARATISHTSSLAGSDAVFDAMCKQVGLIRVYETMHIFDVAQALVTQPLPKGNRVGIIGTGGQGVVTTDSCEALGLKVPELDEETRARLKQSLPPYAAVPRNPVDFAGGVRTALDEVKMAEALARIDYIDGIITSSPTYHLGIDSKTDAAGTALEAYEIIASIPKKYGKPVITMRFRADSRDLLQDFLSGVGIPAYDTPEQCARAMYALAKYAQIRRELGEG